METLTSITVSTESWVDPGDTVELITEATDQFGNEMTLEANDFSWTLEGVGGDAVGGLELTGDDEDYDEYYTAPAGSDGLPHEVVVSASFGVGEDAVVGRANIEITGGWSWYRVKVGGGHVADQYCVILSDEGFANSEDWSAWVLEDSLDSAVKRVEDPIVTGDVTYSYLDEEYEIIEEETVTLTFPDALVADEACFIENELSPHSISFAGDDFSYDLEAETANNWYVKVETQGTAAAIYPTEPDGEGQPATFTITRYNGGSSPSEGLTVNFTLGGSAEIGEHYTYEWSPCGVVGDDHSVTIPCGCGSVSLIIKPKGNADGYPEPKDVTLTLSQGPAGDREQSYTVGPRNEAKVSVERRNNWTVTDWSTGNPMATAGTNQDALAKLAEDIIGPGGSVYASLLPHVQVTKGTQVPIKALLDGLEKNLRSNVAAVAGGVRADARFVANDNSEHNLLTAAQVTAVFDGSGDPITTDCLGMAKIILAQGLITTLNEGEFAEVIKTVGAMHLVDRFVKTIYDAKEGDKLELHIIDEYPQPPWFAQNVIVGSGLSWCNRTYYGFTGFRGTGQREWDESGYLQYVWDLYKWKTGHDIQLIDFIRLMYRENESKYNAAACYVLHIRHISPPRRRRHRKPGYLAIRSQMDCAGATTRQDASGPC